MTARRVIVLGGGGHAGVLVGVLRLRGVQIIGFVDPDPNPDRAERMAIPRLGSDDAVAGYAADDVVLVNGIGSTADTSARRQLFVRFKSAGYRFLEVLHPSAIVADNARLAEGAQIMAGAVIQTGCDIGADALVNTGAVVDHDSRVGAHVHIASGATLSGSVQVGEGTHVGCGAVIIQGITIGQGAVIGAGAVVIADVPAGARVAGNPARSL